MVIVDLLGAAIGVGDDALVERGERELLGDGAGDAQVQRAGVDEGVDGDGAKIVVVGVGEADFVVDKSGDINGLAHHGCKLLIS